MFEMSALSDDRSTERDLSDETRVHTLLATMTFEEKVECLSTRTNIPSLGLKGSGHVEGLHGLALGGPGKWGADDPVPTTTFPQAIGLAQTWNPDLVRRVAEIEAVEARYAFHHLGRGGLVVRAPNADLGRDPRWGRTEECYGEDAYLTGVLATAFVRGLQGNDPKYWRAAALLKHFLANSTEDGREDTSADISPSMIREYYAWPFEQAVTKGGARCFMAAYNAVNGVPCTVNDLLAMTRREWGVDGIVCTDAHAMGMLVSKHHYYDDLAVAAAESVKAGISQFLDDYREPLERALERKLIQEKDLDAAVGANLRVMLRLGLFDSPDQVPHAKIDASRGAPWTWPEHEEVVREVTTQSVVLLKNVGGLLPLSPTRTKTIALIGPLADRVHIDWYSGTPPYWVSPEDGLREHFPGERLVVVRNNDTSEALIAARRADVCIVCVGNHPTGDARWAQVTRESYGKEAIDRKSLILEEEKLVQQVHEVNPNTVLVLVSSFPYAIEWSNENVPAIVQITHNSQELGNALADVLCGKVNPAGRLVQTWPRAIEHVPPLMDFDLEKGRTYMHATEAPLFPFGFGLSYTTFSYGPIIVDRDEVGTGGSVHVSVDVTNEGSLDGDEVVQVYVTRPGSKRTTAKQMLRGFVRIQVPQGQTVRATVTLDANDLRYFDADRGAWQLEPGELRILVGKSSSDIVSEKTIKVIE